MAQFGVLATMRKAGALAGATLLGGLVLVGATAQAASAAAHRDCDRLGHERFLRCPVGRHLRVRRNRSPVRLGR